MVNDNERLRLQQLEELLEAKTMQLNAVTQELDDLSSSISHDLKAPVRAIAGFATILAEEEAGRLSGEGIRLIGIIQKNTKKLSGMIEEIVSYSSISKRKVLLTEVNMQEMVTSIQSSMMSASEQQLITVSVTGIHACRADANMIKQVWLNLFNMSLLYAEKNGFLQLNVTSEKQDDHIVYTLEVKNNALEATRPEKIDALNCEIINRESLEGNGTGAAFIKRAIFKHRGHFWIQAVPGVECTFNMSLPL